MAANKPETYSMRDVRTQTQADDAFVRGLGDYFVCGLGGSVDKLRHFAKYVPRQTLSLFLAKHELFQRIVPVHGHIIECGVFLGGGLMTWAQLSAIHEPYNHIRRIVGFDTFDGFPSLSHGDKGADQAYAVPGGLATNARSDIEEAVRLYDLNRPIGHIPRVELVVGDATESISRYVEENPHLVVALLYLDFDLYEPTLAAIQHLVPRMPKGAVLAFDELGQKAWPGETRAVQEAIGLGNLNLRRFPYTPQLSYAVIE